MERVKFRASPKTWQVFFYGFRDNFNCRIKIFGLNFKFLEMIIMKNSRRVQIFILITVILSFLKRERFPQFVLRRYCVPARMFLSVLNVKRYNPSPFLTVCMSVFMNVSWAYSTLCNLFETRKAQKPSSNGPKRLQNHVHGTFTFTLQKRKNYSNI